MYKLRAAAVLAICFVHAAAAQARADASADRGKLYRQLLTEVSRIAIFDDHAHPGFAEDPEVDAMTSPPGSVPLRLRADNAEFVAASRALFGYPYRDYEPGHARWLMAKKAALKQREGTQYFDSLQRRLNVETTIANRVSMPPYLDRRHFLWAFFADSFFFPFDNRLIRERNVDEQTYIPLQEKLLHRELEQAGLRQLPPALGGYLQFVTKIVDDDRLAGAVAMKFEAAYFRSLFFTDPPEEEAARTYERYRSGGVPGATEYARFQDYVFRHLLREAARLHLAVHFHTSVGVGDYFNLHNGNVLNLENVLRDPRYASVNFVLLHGGLPFDRQAIWLAAPKNVYLDTSLDELMLYPSEFKKILKYWLSIYPEKVCFGSDAFPFNATVGVEESYWLAVRSAREALAGALAELVAEKALTHSAALKVARGYLHDNAARLYGGAEKAIVLGDAHTQVPQQFVSSAADQLAVTKRARTLP